jgi:hypothetical protein
MWYLPEKKSIIYCKVIFIIKNKKEVVELPQTQTVRVRQGNNMALVLFLLFLISAFTETLEVCLLPSQIDFISKVIHDPPDCPAHQMLMACCNNIHPVGHPFLHKMDYIIKNLHHFFHKWYWMQLVMPHQLTCLTTSPSPSR